MSIQPEKLAGGMDHFWITNNPETTLIGFETNAVKGRRDEETDHRGPEGTNGRKGYNTDPPQLE